MFLNRFIKGADISTLPEEERCGAKFYDGGIQDDAVAILKRYGANSVRIRLWNDPYDENGDPYGAGTNDLFTAIELAKRAKSAGMSVLLDFHYSDFWADPGKQYPPKGWESMTGDELAGAVYDFTRKTLLEMKKEGVLPELVQVGNELTNGCCWPLGNRHYQRPSEDDGKGAPYFNPILRKLLCEGIRAVREVSGDITVMIHLDNGGNNALYRDWFDGYFGFDRDASGTQDCAGNPLGAADFDVIGLSYYPFWHGSLSDLSANMNDIAQRYGKELVVAEVSMGHSLDDYRSYEGAAPESLKGMAARRELAAKVDYPMTPDGQKEFMTELCKVIDAVSGQLGRGFYYWEPAWVPVPGCGWATPASLKYIHDPGPCGNEWANQALFDYEGNALPALNVYSL